MKNALLGFAILVFLSEGSSDGLNVESSRVASRVNVTFTLFTRENIYNGVTLTPGDKNSLLASGFQRSLPTIMITHGYNDDSTSAWIDNTKKEILSLGNKNVIILDWSECAKNIIYNEVIECMMEAAVFTGKFLQFLQDAGKFDVERAHLIGHSLGAHLMGFASKVFPTEKTIGRITGLDPAGPLFEHAAESERLNKNSAKLVDVIHTCRVFLGMRKPIGTIDFYPNGGYGQVSCNNMDLRCNHAMSQNYFIETISRDTYLGKKCETLEDAIKGKCDGEVAAMGYRTQYRTPGIYYVRINQKGF